MQRACVVVLSFFEIAVVLVPVKLVAVLQLIELHLVFAFLPLTHKAVQSIV